MTVNYRITHGLIAIVIANQTDKYFNFGEKNNSEIR